MSVYCSGCEGWFDEGSVRIIKDYYWCIDCLKAKETVDHPKHYNTNPSGVECITVVEHMSFNLGNAIKYIWRAGDKGKFEEDIKKAIWYLNRELERKK